MSPSSRLLEANGDKTRITASEAPFALTEEGVTRGLRQNDGWTDFSCCRKAHLQHGVNFRRGKRADHVVGRRHDHAHARKHASVCRAR